MLISCALALCLASASIAAVRLRSQRLSSVFLRRRDLKNKLAIPVSTGIYHKQTLGKAIAVATQKAIASSPTPMWGEQMYCMRESTCKISLWRSLFNLTPDRGFWGVRGDSGRCWESAIAKEPLLHPSNHGLLLDS